MTELSDRQRLLLTHLTERIRTTEAQLAGLREHRVGVFKELLAEGVAQKAIATACGLTTTAVAYAIGRYPRKGSG